jgi:hypothetical protein
MAALQKAGRFDLAWKVRSEVLSRKILMEDYGCDPKLVKWKLR